MEEKADYQEWVKKISQAAGITEEKIAEEEFSLIHHFSSKAFWQGVKVSLGIFLLAAVPRLLFIFLVSGTQNAGVGWYNDSYHHWQIAYLAQQIGFSRGFLRLWDLQGMEYFWGLLHPVLLSFLFTITGSADMLIPRLLNVALGSATAVVAYWLIKRSFNGKAALAAVILIALSPIGIFTDTSGMQEPLGIFLLLTGLFFLPKKTWLTGIVWGLAAMTRAEYWVFATILVGVVVFDRAIKGRLLLVVAFAAIVILYMQYLFIKTGNFVYPIYWNFLGNAAGKWEKAAPLTAQQLAIRNVFIGILVISIIVAFYVLIKKPKLYLFSLLGLGNFMFLSLFVGLSQYLHSYLPRFWVDRIFWLPYLWLSCMAAIGLFFFLPKYGKKVGAAGGMVLLVLIIAALQFAWMPIAYYRTQDTTTLPMDMQYAHQVATLYKSGSILLPGTDPVFTYALYKNGISGAHIRGEMFGPFYYMPQDPFADWTTNRDVVFHYLQQQQVSLLLFTNQDINYQQLVKQEGTHFHFLRHIGPYEVYAVQL